MDDASRRAPNRDQASGGSLRGLRVGRPSLTELPRSRAMRVRGFGRYAHCALGEELMPAFRLAEVPILDLTQDAPSGVHRRSLHFTAIPCCAEWPATGSD